MNCPICNIDLSELDLVSRHEHVELCVENGPSILVANEAGQLVVKSNVPTAKHRKICPICSKTFQSLHAHFKTCALKNDLPPGLMLEYWEKINTESGCDKKFPKDLLDKFVAKCIKEGRMGEQVEFAQALSMSMAESDPNSVRAEQSSNGCMTTQASILTEVSNDATITNDTVYSLTNVRPNAASILLQNAAQQQQQLDAVPTTSRQQKKNNNKPKRRIELADEMTKEANIQLRIERELAATRMKRYEEALLEETKRESSEDNDVCIILDDRPTSQLIDVVEGNDKNPHADDYRSTLFYRSRLKKCNNSTMCQVNQCEEDHNFELTIEGFHRFTLPLVIQTNDKSPDKSNSTTSLKASCYTLSEKPNEQYDDEATTSGIEIDCIQEVLSSASDACPSQ